MRKKMHFSMIVIVLITFCAGFSAKAASKQIKSFGTNSSIMVPGNRQWKKKVTSIKDFKNEKIGTRGVTLGPTQDYSFLDGPDGSQWYATQNNTIENYYYKSSEITLYNNKGVKQSTITVELPDTVNCNQVLVGDVVTNNLFDRNNNTNELAVVVHFIHSPGVTSYVTYVYDIATGELKQTYDGFFSVVKYFTGYNYDAVGVLSYTVEEGGQTISKYDIYTKPGYSKTSAELKHSFSVPNKLAEYQVGSVFNVFEIDNNLYYVLSQYEKEYLDPASYKEPWDMIPTPDNNFVSIIYNKNFVEVGRVTIPVTSTKQYLVQYGVGLFGYKDLSNNFWDESGEMRLVVATAGFEIQTENEAISFDVYDIAGNKVKAIASNVSDWMNMYDIPGESAQMAFLAADGMTMSMVNIPSCETEVTFDSEIDGNVISTSVDRCPVGDSYQYVMGLAAPEVDSEGNVHQRYAWINRNATIDRIVKFNLGDVNANWVPLVIGEVLNPYLFDTDSQREYIFIANQRETPTSSKMIDEIRIVKEDGTIVRVFQEEPNGKGDLGICSLLGLDSNTPTMFIPYYNSNADAITIEMEFLPLAKLSAGGEGTLEKPYLITSAGDMSMISQDLSAHYKIINDFDAGDFGAWKAISGFTGSLDGGNHTVSNLKLNGKDNMCGLFTSAEGSIIKNLVLESPLVEISSNAYTVGFVVAEAMSDTISNVHVKNAVVTASDASAVVGGVVGDATLYTEIYNCSATGLDFDAASSSIGGIAGKIQTSSNVRVCSVSGVINGGKEVGGVVGYASSGCVVKDCHVNASITGENTIGGVVGNAERGGIFNCFIEGDLTAIKANNQGYGKVGGVVGILSPDWSTTADSKVDSIIAGNVVKISTITASEMKGVHRVVGYSRYDSDIESMVWDPTLVPVKEVALANNYVMSDLSVIDSTIEADATSTEGATIEEAELTESFLSSIGYRFGEDVDNPWAIDSENTLYLYFEKNQSSAVESVIIGKSSILFDGQSIMVAGAVAVELYNIAGVKIASVSDGLLQVSDVAAGVYVVVATDAIGARTTAKIVVK